MTDLGSHDYNLDFIGKLDPSLYSSKLKTFYLEESATSVQLCSNNVYIMNVRENYYDVGIMTMDYVRWRPHEQDMMILTEISIGDGWIHKYSTKVIIPDDLSEERYFQYSLIHDIKLSLETLLGIQSLMKTLADNYVE